MLVVDRWLLLGNLGVGLLVVAAAGAVLDWPDIRDELRRRSADG